MSEEISYKLDKFSGPLDLLLQLIEKDKINIYDIPIVQITKQYLEHMAKLETEDLNIMSEFLVMAATLLDIKAKMLLPREVDETTGQEIDPRSELVERLLEHKKYKLMALELAQRQFDAEKLLFKNPTIPSAVSKYEVPVDLDELFGDLTLAKMQKIFEQVIKRRDYRVDTERSKFGTIKKEAVSVAEKISILISYARKNKKFSFKNLLNEQTSKLEVVVTFMAVLELVKMGMLFLTQENLFDDMNIEAIGDSLYADMDLSELGGLQ